MVLLPESLTVLNISSQGGIITVNLATRLTQNFRPHKKSLLELLQKISLEQNIQEENACKKNKSSVAEINLCQKKISYHKTIISDKRTRTNSVQIIKFQ